MYYQLHTTAMSVDQFCQHRKVYRLEDQSLHRNSIEQCPQASNVTLTAITLALHRQTGQYVYMVLEMRLHRRRKHLQQADKHAYVSRHASCQRMQSYSNKVLCIGTLRKM